jgi:hypothetical protein
MKRGGSSNIDKLPELLRRLPETRADNVKAVGSGLAW